MVGLIEFKVFMRKIRLSFNTWGVGDTAQGSLVTFQGTLCFTSTFNFPEFIILIIEDSGLSVF